MQPRFNSEMSGQGTKHTRLQGKIASEFSTDIVFPPYKVVNTGIEAKNADDLRGGFYSSTGIRKNKHYRNERTKYEGIHWVEAFIVKNGVCVGRSGEFIVNIE
jgi:hypothetical protein